ncbi:hypothetical protein [Aquimarina hainanensis]
MLSLLFGTSSKATSIYFFWKIPFEYRPETTLFLHKKTGDL